MKLNLDTPSPEFDEEQKAQLERDNVAALRKTLNKTGISQTLLVQTTTAFAFSSGSFVDVGNMRGVVTSSGGFFNITFKSTARVSGGGVTVKLFIDGVLAINLKDSIVVSSTTDDDLLVFLKWDGYLGEGRHTIFVQAAGVATFSFSSSHTTLQATETLL